MWWLWVGMILIILGIILYIFCLIDQEREERE
ncbi:hypothetical protein ES708_06535 [subsurface metagenome]